MCMLKITNRTVLAKPKLAWKLISDDASHPDYVRTPIYSCRYRVGQWHQAEPYAKKIGGVRNRSYGFHTYSTKKAAHEAAADWQRIVPVAIVGRAAYGTQRRGKTGRSLCGYTAEWIYYLKVKA